MTEIAWAGSFAGLIATAMKSILIFAVLSVMPAFEADGVNTGAIDPAQDVEQSAPSQLGGEETLALLKPPAPATQTPESGQADAVHCREGALVMIPDGREGVVTSWDGSVCRVLAYGEAYVSLWMDEMIEPIYPQSLPKYAFGH